MARVIDGMLSVGSLPHVPSASTVCAEPHAGASAVAVVAAMPPIHKFASVHHLWWTNTSQFYDMHVACAEQQALRALITFSANP